MWLCAPMWMPGIKPVSVRRATDSLTLTTEPSIQPHKWSGEGLDSQELNLQVVVNYQLNHLKAPQVALVMEFIKVNESKLGSVESEENIEKSPLVPTHVEVLCTHM